VAFTVADYIVRRLKEQNVNVLFGVPAAYCARCSMLRRAAA
jgi:indolepyruvate decarboxylase